MKQTLTRTDRIQRLPNIPEVGRAYRNGKSLFLVYSCNSSGSAAQVYNIKSGWICRAHNPALYQMEDGHIELQWDYSTDGYFAPRRPFATCIMWFGFFYEGDFIKVSDENFCSRKGELIYVVPIDMCYLVFDQEGNHLLSVGNPFTE